MVTGFLGPRNPVTLSLFNPDWFKRYRGDYSSLLANYSSLVSSYQRLRGDYDSLRDTYADLLNKYTLLESRYAELLGRYRELSKEHEALQATIAEKARALETLLYVAIALGVATVALLALLARRKI